jgi:hypothetical protein
MIESLHKTKREPTKMIYGESRSNLYHEWFEPKFATADVLKSNATRKQAKHI